MNELYERYQSELKIDRDDLDNELVRQPGNFHAVSYQWTLACSRRDAQKLAVKGVHGREWNRIREKVEAEGNRATVDLMTAMLEKSKKYREAQDLYNEAVAEAEAWGALKEAWMQRSYALKDLVNLFVAQYFETDSMSGRKSGNDEYEKRRTKLKKNRKS